MKQLLYLVPMCFFLMATSCGGDDTTVLPEPEISNVNLTFKTMFGANELDFNTTDYDYQGMTMTFSRFDFFVSNVALFKNVDGVVEQTELFEIDFVDLTNSNNSVTIETMDVPVGTYDGILFSIGVPSDLNSQVPADFSSTHPLGITNGGHHWLAWDSYIFSKLEGRLDTSGNQDYVPFSYHPGTDALFSNSIEKSIVIDLTSGGTKTINFEIDLERMLLDGGALDIVTYPDSHSPEEMTGAAHVMDNFPNAIYVE